MLHISTLVYLLAVVMLGMFTTAPQNGTADGLLKRTVKVGPNSYSYQVHVPAARSRAKSLPVILFLHGIGQRGEEGFVPTAGSAGALARSYLERVPAIVVLPQCRAGRYWSDAEMTRMTIQALDDAITAYGGDPKRVYLVGVSMGGYGAWHLAAEHPRKFAAVVPICGGSPLPSEDRFTLIARKVRRTPVWLFHGAEDRVVPVTESRRMVEALKAAGGQVRYSEYEGVGHNVWLQALGEPELLPWLLSQQLD